SYDRSGSTGVDYAVNRSYSSGQSRFTQVDPIGMSSATVGEPQSNNLYAYVQNFPNDAVDPCGLNESMCSAENSYGQCGGGAGFWGMMGSYGSWGGYVGGGGGFGDGVAYHNSTYGGLPDSIAAGLGLHMERLSNAQSGNGFRTHAEVVAATFTIAY